jgi:hypothetical protein
MAPILCVPRDAQHPFSQNLESAARATNMGRFPFHPCPAFGRMRCTIEVSIQGPKGARCQCILGGATEPGTRSDATDGMNTMSKIDREERKILQAFERAKLRSIDSKGKRAKLETAARATIASIQHVQALRRRSAPR